MRGGSRRRVAVVGSGVSGLTAAHLLQRTADVTLIEAADRLGGHVHTHHLTLADGAPAAVDSGFIVCNDRTYPTLVRLFDELGVTIVPTEMSMAVGCDGCGLAYVGGRGLGGIFAQRRRVVDPRFLRLLFGIRRFQRLARRVIDEDVDSSETYGEFLSRHGFGQFFVDHYAIPVVACVWSSGADDALRYPAGYLFAFLANHGFLQARGAPQWYVVEGGSSSYVARIADGLSHVLLQTPVTSVTNHQHGVALASEAGPIGEYDAVVIATHADQALAMLTQPTTEEREVLGAFEYTENQAVLHRDASVLPVDRRARGSWNYRMSSCGRHGSRVQASYWMNRLQHHDERSPLVVTLNPAEDLPPAAVIAAMTYAHPIYTAASRAAQRRLAEIDSDRVVFAGAHHGWGFHEDGCVAGVAAARRLESDLVNDAAPSPLAVSVPALVRGRVRHDRVAPFRHGFTYRAHQWLVDVDKPDVAPRRLRWLGSLAARDHIGRPDGSLGANIREFLATQGVPWRAARVLMLANARTFGYVFDPLSVWWCFDDDGALEGVVAEVHNTYGERHAYVLELDNQGRGQADKAFYVSPFLGVFGDYQLRFTLDGDRVGTFVTLRQEQRVVFTASFIGTAEPLTNRRLLTSALTSPFMPQRVSLLIRLQGVRLWMRRLPVVRRLPHRSEPGT